MAGCIGLLIQVLICESFTADLLVVSHLITLKSFRTTWTWLFEINGILIHCWCIGTCACSSRTDDLSTVVSCVLALVHADSWRRFELLDWLSVPHASGVLLICILIWLLLVHIRWRMEWSWWNRSFFAMMYSLKFLSLYPKHFCSNMMGQCFGLNLDHFHQFLCWHDHLVQTTGHWLSQVLWEHWQAWTFLLQHRPCRYIQRNSYRLFGSLFFSLHLEFYGMGLLHQTDQNFHYLSLIIFMECKVVSDLLIHPNLLFQKMDVPLFLLHHFFPNVYQHHK